MDLKLTRLIEDTQAGDEASFSLIREQYAGLLHSLSAQMIAKLPEAEFDDLMQEASLALYHAALRFDTAQEDVTFGLYAKICIRNRLISVARRMSKRKFDSRRQPPVLPTATEKKAARRVAYRDLDEIAQQVLSNFEYTVYQLYLDGYSVAEMANQLDKSSKSIDNAIYRMKKKIKSQCKQPSHDSVE